MPEPKEKTLDAMIDAVAAVEGMDESDKVWLFIQMLNEKTLIQCLNKHAMCLDVGISPPDPIYDFAYGVLKLAKPHLFEKVDAT